MKAQRWLLVIWVVVFVCGSGVYGVDRVVPSPLYPTIQAGIDASGPGDVVVISPGAYTGAGNRDLDFGGKAITVRSVNPGDPAVVAATVIDCEGSAGDPHRGFYFHSGEGPDSVVSGLTITDGYVYDANGGGIYCYGSSPTISDCVISDNTVGGRDANCCAAGFECGDENGGDASGGGIHCGGNSNPVILRCTIRNNEVRGGIGRNVHYCQDWVTGGNGGNGSGGGIHCESGSSPSIIDCTIRNNTVFGGESGSSKSAGAYGGGICCVSGSNPEIAGCDIRENEAYGGNGVDNSSLYDGGRGGDSFGGGIYGDLTSSPVVRSCRVELNHAFGGAGGNGLWGSTAGANGGHSYGGGIYSNAGSGVVVENSTITSNTSSGGAGGFGGNLEPHPYRSSRGGDAYGGGLCLADGSGYSVRNCLIVNNVARGGEGGNDSRDNTLWPGAGGDTYGGGIYWIPGSGQSMNNCSVAYNAVWVGNGGWGWHGTGGEWVKAAPDGNDYGAGLYCEDLLVRNSIVWGNDANDANQVDGSGFGVTYSDVENGLGGIGNISLNPLFASGPEGDFYLSQMAAGQGVDSPCVDAGSDLAVNLGMDTATTRTDEVNDVDIVDMGFHYGDSDSMPGGITVPNVVGLILSQAVSAIAAEGLVVGTMDNRYSQVIPAGYVMSQYPEGGTLVDEGADVNIVTSLGRPSTIAGDADYDGDVDGSDYALIAYDWQFGDVNTIAMGSVEVDGDFNDWPWNIEWKQLDERYDGNPNDVGEARFALQWDPDTDKVYAVIVVDDADHVFTDNYVSWNASDRIEVYSQGDAAGGSGWSGVYDVAQHYMVGPDTSGGDWATWGLGESIAGDAGFEYAVGVFGDRIVYEIGVAMFDNYGGISGGETTITDLNAGDVVGFDLAASTRWSGGFGMLSENLMGGKYDNADAFARYLLVEHVGCADLDGDGVNTFKDLSILCENWLEGAL